MYINSADKHVDTKVNPGQVGTRTQNGIIITGKNTTPSTVKNRCFKCGHLKSQHTGLFKSTCPKG